MFWKDGCYLFSCITLGLIGSFFFIGGSFLTFTEATINQSSNSLANGSSITVTTSVEPSQITNYIMQDPYLGRVQVNQEECADGILPERINSQQAGKMSRVELQVAGGGESFERILPIDVVLAIDSSGSMRVNDPTNLRLSAANTFLGKLDSTTDMAGVVSWDEDIDFTFSLTKISDSSDSGESIKSRINKIDNSGGTNLDLGLKNAVLLLDQSLRNNASSKAIIFLTDGEEGQEEEQDQTEFYTPSGNAGSLVDYAKAKDYKIFSIGLNINPGSVEEYRLKDMAIGSGGQYYFPPTAENLQAAFDNIYESVIKNTEPKNVDVIETLPEGVEIQRDSFNIPPTTVENNAENQTIIRWKNIGSYVGNNDNSLAANESFMVMFSVILPSNAENQSNVLPLAVSGGSFVEYTDSSGNVRTVGIPQNSISLETKECQEQQIPFRIIYDKIIVPGSENGTFAVYKERGSNVFSTSEEIRLFILFSGKAQKPIVDNTGFIRYLSNTTANFDLIDMAGNPSNQSENSLTPFDTQTIDYRVENSSYTLWNYITTGAREPGNYVLKYNITDNLSGKTIGGFREVVIEGQQAEPNIGNKSYVPTNSNQFTGGIQIALFGTKETYLLGPHFQVIQNSITSN